MVKRASAPTHDSQHRRPGKCAWRVASLRRRVKGDLRVEFVRQELISCSGLELLRRYFALLDVPRRIRESFSAYGRLVLLIIALLVVGARRSEHPPYLAQDPLGGRLCGVARIPLDRTVANWLKQCRRRR